MVATYTKEDLLEIERLKSQLRGNKMLLNLNKIVLLIDGKPMRPTELVGDKVVVLENEELLLSKMVGNILYNVTGVEDALKYKTMGEDLYRDGEINVDESDLNKIEDLVKKQEQWPACIIGPIQAAIRQARNKAVADS